MISLYASAVLTTVMVAGVALYSIDESRKGPAYAYNAPAVARAHEYAMHRGETDHPGEEGVTGIHEVNLGPYFQNGVARSFVRTNYDPLNTPSNQLWTTYYMTWFESGDAQESQRIARKIDIEEKDGQETWVGVYDESGEGVDGRFIPDVAVTIPLNAVLIVTEVIGGEP